MNKKNSNPLTVPCIVLAVMSVCSLVAVTALLNENNELNSELIAQNENSRMPDLSAYAYSETQPTETEITESTVTETVTETEQETEAENTAESVTEEPLSEETTETTKRTIDENTVYIYDNGDEIIEYPEIKGAVFNDYDMSLLQTDEKKHKALYDADGNKISRFGIDVSSYQNQISWPKVANDGVEFVMLRCAYRGYETGRIVEDKYFRWNASQAIENGLDVGVYFYSQALTEAEAVEEAEYTIKLLKDSGIEPTMPIVFDWEFSADEDPARTDDMTGEQQLACCRAFCDTISKNGYQPMYYSNIKTALFRYDIGVLADIPCWIANYYASNDYVYDYAMWQYSCSGVVDGIESLVDLDIYIEK